MVWRSWRRLWARPDTAPGALPDDVGLPSPHRPGAARAPAGDDVDDDDASRPDRPDRPDRRPAPATPVRDSHAGAPLTAPVSLDPVVVAAAAQDVADLVRTLDLGERSAVTDLIPLVVGATGALAARLPALSGVDGAVLLDEPADELLHAYAQVLATRAGARPGGRGAAAGPEDSADLAHVAHVAAAAAAADAAADPALLVLADVPHDRQLRAALLLLAQSADDGGGAPDRLTAEVRALFSG